MTDIAVLQPILLGDVMEEQHLAAISRATGKEASTLFLVEPSMRDYRIAVEQAVGSENDNVNRDAYAINACVREKDGGEVFGDDGKLLDGLPASTYSQLNTLVAGRIMQIQAEGKKALGKMVEILKVDLPKSSEQPS